MHGLYSYYSERRYSTVEGLNGANRGTIAVFIYILRRLGKFFNLPQPSLHVFFDDSREAMTFNYNGSVSWLRRLKFFEV